MRSLTLLALVAARTASAHFVLQIPTSLGYDDSRLVESPCGSFDPRERSTGVADWPVDGHPVSVISTHGDVEWEVNAALIDGGSGPLTFEPIVVPFRQQGVGFVCFEVVPGHPEWVGRDAVVQIIQHAIDGDLHQCAAVRFVAGGPASVPGDCENTTGVEHEPIVAPPRGGTTTTTTTAATTSAASSTSATTQPTSSSAPTTAATTASEDETSSASSAAVTSKTTTSAGTSGGHGHGSSGGHGTGTAASTGTSTSPATVPTAAANLAYAPVGVMVAGAAVAAGWGLY